MNEALILLLVIFVQSQSDGIFVPNPTSRHFQDSRLEGWNGGEFPYEEDVSEDYKKRSLTNDAFTRRSALDKNFMRFGRGSEAQEEHRRHFGGRLAFYRFVRGLKDSFIRFGRGGEKSGFIRFGRTRPEDFFRAGKSLRENFIRFGKADKNFMRFGRYQESLSSGEPFRSTQDNFMRFGRGLKNATGLLVFGKGDWDGSDENDQDFASQKETKRKRRRTQQEHFMRQPTLADFANRNSNGPLQFLPFLPGNFPGRISPALNGSWLNFQVIRPSRLTPFFPNLLKHVNTFGTATKRDRGNSNFIRFG